MTHNVSSGTLSLYTTTTTTYRLALAYTQLTRDQNGKKVLQITKPKYRLAGWYDHKAESKIVSKSTEITRHKKWKRRKGDATT